MRKVRTCRRPYFKITKWILRLSHPRMRLRDAKLLTGHVVGENLLIHEARQGLFSSIKRQFETYHSAVFSPCWCLAKGYFLPRIAREMEKLFRWSTVLFAISQLRETLLVFQSNKFGLESSAAVKSLSITLPLIVRQTVRYYQCFAVLVGLTDCCCS